MKKLLHYLEILVGSELPPDALAFIRDNNTPGGYLSIVSRKKMHFVSVLRHEVADDSAELSGAD